MEAAYTGAASRRSVGQELPGRRWPGVATDWNLGVVNKVGSAAGANRCVLSGGFGTARWSHDYSLGTIRRGLLHGGQLPPRVAQRFRFARAPLLFLSYNQRSGSPLIREQKLAREPSVNRSDSQILASWVNVRYWIRAWKGVYRCAPGLNRHVVGNARVLQERRKRIHLGPESYGRRREASAEA